MSFQKIYNTMAFHEILTWPSEQYFGPLDCGFRHKRCYYCNIIIQIVIIMIPLLGQVMTTMSLSQYHYLEKHIHDSLIGRSLDLMFSHSFLY